jgi:hypothetical protein
MRLIRADDLISVWPGRVSLMDNNFQMIPRNGYKQNRVLKTSLYHDPENDSTPGKDHEAEGVGCLQSPFYGVLEYLSPVAGRHTSHRKCGIPARIKT